MEEPTPQAIEPETNQKPKVKKSHVRAVLYVITIVLILAAGAGAYWWRDNNASNFEKQQATDIASYKATIASLEKDLADAKDTNTTDEQTPCTEVAPIAATIDNIKASITSGNTAALEGYMATSVNVILAASEAYGTQTPTQAVSDISSFISSDITAWDYNFSLSAATIAGYKTGDYSQYFPSIAVVGKATNKKVISFSFDCNGKIDTVFMATDEALL